MTAAGVSGRCLGQEQSSDVWNRTPSPPSAYSVPISRSPRNSPAPGVSDSGHVTAHEETRT